MSGLFFVFCSGILFLIAVVIIYVSNDEWGKPKKSMAAAIAKRDAVILEGLPGHFVHTKERATMKDAENFFETREKFGWWFFQRRNADKIITLLQDDSVNKYKASTEPNWKHLIDMCTQAAEVCAPTPDPN